MLFAVVKNRIKNRGAVKREQTGFSLKGCQIVAGGRSVAQTTGKLAQRIQQPEGLPE
jgi:hypothetical protein